MPGDDAVIHVDCRNARRATAPHLLPLVARQCGVVRHDHQVDQDHLRELMDLFDENDNQSLSYNELRDLFSECGIEMENEEFASLYLMMDKDGDKEVDMTEVRKEGGGAWFLGFYEPPHRVRDGEARTPNPG